MKTKVARRRHYPVKGASHGNTSEDFSVPIRNVLRSIDCYSCKETENILWSLLENTTDNYQKHLQGEHYHISTISAVKHDDGRIFLKTIKDKIKNNPKYKTFAFSLG